MEENLEGDSLLGTDGHGFYKKDTDGLRNGNGLISIFLPHPSSPARIFLPHPSSPARRGSTSLLNTLASPKSFTLGNVQMQLTLLSLNQDFPILRREDLKPGRPGLYSQTSARPVGVARGVLRNRVANVYAPWAPIRMGDG